MRTHATGLEIELQLQRSKSYHVRAQQNFVYIAREALIIPCMVTIHNSFTIRRRVLRNSVMIYSNIVNICLADLESVLLVLLQQTAVNCITA